MLKEKKTSRGGWLALAAAVAVLAVTVLLDNLPGVPPMLLTVLRKGSIYALVAVSMNLLNGFTGLFSLGQAGFMLLGAYTYSILTIPVASQAAVYQRYDNGGVHFSITESLSGALGGVGLLLGVLICLVLAGLAALVVIGWDIWFIISPNLKLPLLRSGFRMVVFSVVIMVMVLFFRKGLFGDREITDLFRKRRAAKAGKGGAAQ